MLVLFEGVFSLCVPAPPCAEEVLPCCSCMLVLFEGVVCVCVPAPPRACAPDPCGIKQGPCVLVVALPEDVLPRARFVRVWVDGFEGESVREGELVMACAVGFGEGGRGGEEGLDLCVCMCKCVCECVCVFVCVCVLVRVYGKAYMMLWSIAKNEGVSVCVWYGGNC